MKAKLLLGLFVAMVAVALMHSPAEAGDCRGVLQLHAQAVYAQPVLQQVQYAAPIQFQQSDYLAPQNIQFQNAYTVPATQFRVVRFQQSSHHAPQQQRSRSRQSARFVAPPQQAIVLRQEVPVQRGRNTQIGFINFGR